MKLEVLVSEMEQPEIGCQEIEAVIAIYMGKRANDYAKNFIRI